MTPLEADRMKAIIDGLDHLAREMEERWGVGRLELLVDDELRLKFRRQLDKLNAAIDANDVERTAKHAAGMRKAWAALDLAAKNAGALALDPEVWEIRLPDGRVIAFTKTRTDAAHVTRSNRYLDVWSTEEIATVVTALPQIVKAKQTFPGATVIDVRPRRAPLDEANGDPIPF
jgi:hypothetical protein